MRKLLWVLLFCASSAAFAATPSRVEMTFTISYGNMRIGEGRDVLVRDGKRYMVNSTTTPVGLAAIFISEINRESRGHVTEAGLKPEYFKEDRGRRGQRIAAFDWESDRLTLTQDEHTHSVDLPPGTLDHASFQFSFIFSPPDEDGIKLPLTDGRRVKEYRYRLVGPETLQTPVGPIETLHFEREVDPEEKRRFEVWLAIDRHHLPVQIRYEEKGRTFNSIVTGISIE